MNQLKEKILRLQIMLKKKRLTGEKIVFYYHTIVFALFPLYLPAGKLQNITHKGILFSILTFAAAVAYIVLLCKGQAVCSKHFYRIDLCMAVLLIVSIIRVLISAVKGRDDYELYILVSVSILEYFLLSRIMRGEEVLDEGYLMDLFMLSSMAVYVQLLIHVFAVPQFYRPVELLIQDTETICAFLVLSVSVSILQYCRNQNSSKDKWYLFVTVIGFFLLFLQNNFISIIMIIGFILSIPILFRATAELIKRNLIMAFFFFFILSIMPFAEGYVKPAQIVLNYDIKISIYLDIIIAVFGFIMLCYWERIPKTIQADSIVLIWVRKAYIFTFKAAGIMIAGVLFSGGFEGIEGRMGIKMLSRFKAALWNEISHSNGTFGQIMEAYGIIGVILIVVLASFIIARLRKNYKCTVQSAILTSITVMFLAQSLFYKQQAITLPIYTVLITWSVLQDKRITAQHQSQAVEEKERKSMKSHSGSIIQGV